MSDVSLVQVHRVMPGGSDQDAIHRNIFRDLQVVATPVLKGHHQCMITNDIQIIMDRLFCIRALCNDNRKIYNLIKISGNCSSDILCIMSYRFIRLKNSNTALADCIRRCLSPAEHDDVIVPAQIRPVQTALF